MLSNNGDTNFTIWLGEKLTLRIEAIEIKLLQKSKLVHERQYLIYKYKKLNKYFRNDRIKRCVTNDRVKRP